MNFTDNLILLVEDEEYLAKMYQVEFELADFKVRWAKDGEEALSLASVTSPQIIVCDIMLPKMDGLTVLQKLKADEHTSDIPVIILTNYGDQKNMKTAFSLGAADFVVKYFATPKEVIEKVKGVLEKTSKNALNTPA
jgi:two-component system alkaline phosphatase synthesis response regulator PhoP